MNEALPQEIAKRRTFAIISHPDAGKTTLTEKLLLYSGMIHTAGMVRAKKGRKAATSDWMAMEQERGISITSSAMQFPYKDAMINVLDTPGHQDFSEDTYRTLTAADCAIMVIDAAKGVEKQTRKLFEVCRLRKIPVMTLINKYDLPAQNPLDLMNEVEEVLSIKSSAWNWPTGSSKEFLGVIDRQTNELELFSKAAPGGSMRAGIQTLPWNSQEAKDALGLAKWNELQDELNLLEIAGNPFDKNAFLNGELTPVFFASALTNYGIEPFLDAFINLAPCPHERAADAIKGGEITIDPVTSPFSAYVFKIQANMDKRHRDSMAFLRICSGVFTRDMTVKHQRLGKEIRLSRPHGMVAGERTTLDQAYPGDIIGVINPGVFAVGDTISQNGGFTFKPLPYFQPEIFARVTPKEVGKRKAFDKGVQQLTSEGAIQLLVPFDDMADPLFAAVGQLQFEVMQYRLLDEYGVETRINPQSYQASAWLIGDLETFKKPSTAIMVWDAKKRPMVIFEEPWEKRYAAEQNPNHQLVDIL